MKGTKLQINKQSQSPADDLLPHAAGPPIALAIAHPLRTDYEIESEEPKIPARVAPSSLALNNAAPPFALDSAQPLAALSFPNQPRNSNQQVPATIPNIQYLLAAYGVLVRYNVIRKKLSVSMPGYSGSPDNIDNVALAQITSLATLNGLPVGLLPGFVDAVGDRNLYNPVADWIKCKPWDGIDRLQAISQTLVVREDFPVQLRNILLHRWLISAVAAALMPQGFRARGVLTLQGPQSIGKTAWVNALVPDPILREGVVKLDHHLDAGSKDSLLTAISHWIVEVGELDSSFKKDVARLKGFLTADRDKVRRPYGRTDSEYPRRTVFCATVNDHDFLVDSTGNSRWWTIPVVKINFQHGIDMQQLFAQLAIEYEEGDKWWLTVDEEFQLEEQNKKHRHTSVIRDRVIHTIDLRRIAAPNLPALTPTAFLQSIGINNPTNTQSKECASVFRELLGESKRINGQNKWRVPLKQTESMYSPKLDKEDLDLY